MSIEILNNLQENSYPKFKQISKYKIPRQLPYTKVNTSSSKCVVIFVYSTLYYAKYAYICLASLLKYTDIRNYDIKIVTNDNVYEEVKSIFEPVLGKGSVILSEPFKYSVFDHEYFDNKEKICFMDADAFIYSREKVNLFFDLFENSYKIIMKDHEVDDINLLLKHRAHILGNNDILLEKFRNIKSWKLAGLSVYSTDMFKTDEAKDIFDMGKEAGCTDDEALILSIVQDKCLIKNSNEIIKWSHGGEVDDFTINPKFSLLNNRLFVHPIEGNHNECDRCVTIYNEIFS